MDVLEIEIGSAIYANKPGDGSAREQAASCQRVIGGLANITQDYATKRYRSNVMNWGMLPFHLKGDPDRFEADDYIYVPAIKKHLQENRLDSIRACGEDSSPEWKPPCEDICEKQTCRRELRGSSFCRA